MTPSMDQAKQSVRERDSDLSKRALSRPVCTAVSRIHRSRPGSGPRRPGGPAKRPGGLWWDCFANRIVADLSTWDRPGLTDALRRPFRTGPAQG